MTEGAAAAAASIPVLARSVGGTSSQHGAIVFRIPGIGNAYTAHVSEDATIFVQSREVFAQPVCLTVPLRRCYQTSHCVARSLTVMSTNKHHRMFYWHRLGRS
jgi:hypothetical protein